MTARDLAADVADGDRVDWRELQAAAFEQQPTVLAALDPRSGTGGARPRLAGIGSAAAFLLLAAVFVAPVAGFVIVTLGWIAGDPGAGWSIPTASIVFLCTTPLLAALVVEWYRSDRKREGSRELQVSLLAGFGVPSFVVMLVRSLVQGYPDGVRWSAGIAVPTLFAAIFWVKLLWDARRLEVRYGRGAPETATDGGLPSLEPLQHVRLAVEALSEEDRGAVRADLAAAIDDLEQRGVIDDSTAAWALGAPLGKLPMHMAQRPEP